MIAGSDDADGIAYRLTLPPPRRERLAEFRVLVVDAHPLMPTALAVREALDQLVEKLVRRGAHVARGSPLLPDLAEAARLHQKLVYAFSQAFGPPEVYRRIEAAVAQLSPDDQSLAAWRSVLDRSATASGSRPTRNAGCCATNGADCSRSGTSSSVLPP